MYAVDLTKLLARTLGTFTTQNAHQLAGHVANVRFWLAEVRHSLEVLDGYRERFERLKDAQMAHVAKRSTWQFELNDEYLDSGEQIPAPKRAIKDSELKELRRSICDATYRFLLRCYNESLIDESCFKQSADELGISVDPADVRGERGIR